MLPMAFEVPFQKRVRMIVDTDCKTEADDQYALVHHLLTPMFDVRCVIAAHFEIPKVTGKDFMGWMPSMDSASDITCIRDSCTFKAMYREP